MKGDTSLEEPRLSAEAQNRKGSVSDLDDIEASLRARFSVDSPESELSSPLTEIQKPSSGSLLRRILVISGFILLWFTFSLILSLYNKWMFAPAHLDFPFPLFVTSLHMVMQFILSGITLWIFPSLRPKREDYLSFRDYAYDAFGRGPDNRIKIGPCGVATGLDIGLSNASLKFITLAFYSECPK
jgi:solute carrier family 35, member C2